MAPTEGYLWPLFGALSSAGSYFGVTALLCITSKLLWRRYIIKSAEDPSSHLTKTLPLPPGDFGIPFIGETLSWAFQGSKFNSSRRKQYGNVFCTHFLGKAMVKVTGADNVRQILLGEHDKVTTIWPTSFRRILGEHTIVNTMGDKHKYMRKMAMKGFTQAALNGYIPDARKIISKQVTTWAVGGVQKVYNDILQMTFEVSTRAMVGIEFETNEERQTTFNRFHEMVSNLFSLPYDVPFSGFRKGIRRKEAMHEVLDPYIRNKVKRIASDAEDTEGKDAIHFIIAADLKERVKRESKDSGIESERSSGEDDERGVTVEELKQTAVELMFAGFLTTGSSLSSLVILLAKHPEVREKVEEELYEHGLLDSETEDITLEKVQKLTYLEQVIKETLRVMPPVLGGYRKALKTFQIGEYRIPKGWTIIYNIRDTHEYEFGDDTEFNPDRFSRKIWSEDRRNRFKWLPFGGGSRMCLGKELARLIMKLSIIELVKKFQSWKFEGDKPPPMFAVPNLHPTNGLPIIFSPR